MKFSLNVVFQIAAVIAQVLTMISGLVPPSWQPAIHVILTIVQAVVSFGAHFNNPDGTPATRAYVKE